MKLKPANNNDRRFAEVLDVIFRYAAGDLKARGILSENESDVDGVMAGVNMLGEELEAYAAEPGGRTTPCGRRSSTPRR